MSSGGAAGSPAAAAVGRGAAAGRGGDRGEGGEGAGGRGGGGRERGGAGAAARHRVARRRCRRSREACRSLSLTVFFFFLSHCGMGRSWFDDGLPDFICELLLLFGCHVNSHEKKMSMFPLYTSKKLFLLFSKKKIVWISGVDDC